MRSVYFVVSDVEGPRGSPVTNSDKMIMQDTAAPSFRLPYPRESVRFQ